VEGSLPRSARDPTARDRLHARTPTVRPGLRQPLTGGRPTEFEIPGFGVRTGFTDTPEGATVAGQPEVAAGWFPVNDHPLDKASYSFDVTVPDRYEAVANGILRDTEHRGRETIWEWEATEPMVSYLATIDIADWDAREWTTDDGLPVYDAVDTGGGRAAHGAARPSCRGRGGRRLDPLRHPGALERGPLRGWGNFRRAVERWLRDHGSHGGARGTGRSVALLRRHRSFRNRAQSLGCPAVRIEHYGDLLQTLDEVMPNLARRAEPLVVDVVVAPDD
jgi:hypothetical protein